MDFKNHFFRKSGLNARKGIKKGQKKALFSCVSYLALGVRCGDSGDPPEIDWTLAELLPGFFAHGRLGALFCHKWHFLTPPGVINQNSWYRFCDFEKSAKKKTGIFMFFFDDVKKTKGVSPFWRKNGFLSKNR